MEEKMARFDDVADNLKSSISKVKKKEEAKTKHEENIIQEEMFRRMQEELKRQYEKRYKIVNKQRVMSNCLHLTKLDGTSLDWSVFLEPVWEWDWQDCDCSGEYIFLPERSFITKSVITFWRYHLKTRHRPWTWKNGLPKKRTRWKYRTSRTINVVICLKSCKSRCCNESFSCKK